MGWGEPELPSQPLRLRISYDNQRFERAVIEHLILHVQNSLQQLVDDPERKLAAISLLTPEERHQILVQWNTTSVGTAPCACPPPPQTTTPVGTASCACPPPPQTTTPVGTAPCACP